MAAANWDELWFTDAETDKELDFPEFESFDEGEALEAQLDEGGERAFIEAFSESFVSTRPASFRTFTHLPHYFAGEGLDGLSTPDEGTPVPPVVAASARPGAYSEDPGSPAERDWESVTSAAYSEDPGSPAERDWRA
jgi:hypothetical protein